MNTLTIAILVICATMAYAAVIPGPEASPIQSAAAVETDLEGQESARSYRNYGYGGFRNHGGYRYHGHGGYRNYGHGGYGHHGYGYGG